MRANTCRGPAGQWRGRGWLRWPPGVTQAASWRGGGGPDDQFFAGRTSVAAVGRGDAAARGTPVVHRRGAHQRGGRGWGTGGAGDDDVVGGAAAVGGSL